jgi:predicted P-loop ATPase
MENSYHPVRNYLNDLVWDGQPRVGRWLTTYAGAEYNQYTGSAGPSWLVSGVARIFEPGCKVDHTIIFEGPQGGGKSSLFAELGGEFYSDDVPELGTKDAALACAGIWILELSELSAMNRADLEKIKSFISRTEDRFRPPYDRHMVTVPRQCVFCGTVNVDRYLKDETGGRRFWPIECGTIDLEKLRDDRDQLWAEAVYLYHNKFQWWPTDAEVIAEATAEQEERYQADPWEEEIQTWLSDQMRLRGRDTLEVTTAEILKLGLRKETGQWTRVDEARVGVILKRLGWTSHRLWNSGEGPRRRVYRPPAAASAADGD